MPDFTQAELDDWKKVKPRIEMSQLLTSLYEQEHRNTEALSSFAAAASDAGDDPWAPAVDLACQLAARA